MGMQVIPQFLAIYWLALLILAVVILLVVYSVFEARALCRQGPKDTSGNGITIGSAKAFDNRSLALRIERLSTSLAALRIVNQNITENLSTFQAQSSSETIRSLALYVNSNPTKAGSDSSSQQQNSNKDVTSDPKSSADAAKADIKPAIGLAAGDILSDQLNLASQIVNLDRSSGFRLRSFPSWA
jgi:hypothetical protein